MADPLFYLQVVDANGHPVTSPLRPMKARHGSLDFPLIEMCEAEILKRGVGFFKTEAKVRQAIRDGMAAALQQLKDDYRPVGHG